MYRVKIIILIQIIKWKSPYTWYFIFNFFIISFIFYWKWMPLRYELKF